MTIPPETRRANRWLLVGLIVFALALCATVLIWMRVNTRAKGGVVDRQEPHAVYWHPAPTERFPAGRLGPDLRRRMTGWQFPTLLRGSAALKGPDVIAQGNALGRTDKIPPVLQGRDVRAVTVLFRPDRAGSFLTVVPGVAPWAIASRPFRAAECIMRPVSGISLDQIRALPVRLAA